LLDSPDDWRQRQRTVLRLITFGGVGLESDDGSVPSRLRPPRLALLAVLAAAGERGVSRERIAGLLWPESDEQRASHSLRQARYALRSEIDLEVIRSEGSVLSLDPATITSDVAEFNAALAAGDRRRAVSLVRGPFLDGFYLPNASEFERWVEEERARLAATTSAALVSLANEASQAGEHDAAVECWRSLTLRDPLSGRFALGYVKALAARGDRADALGFVRQHTAVVRRELDAEPDPEIKRLEGELRSTPTSIVGRRTPVSIEAVADAAEPKVAAEPERITPAQEPVVLHVSRRNRARRSLIAVGAAAVLVLTATAALAWQRGWFTRDLRPVMAVGLIREDGLPDSQRVGGVLTDMLATNLARVDGLAVLANSRVLEMMQPARGRDSSAAYADAARRAGASELLEGRVTTLPHGALELEMRRVELNSGIVREVYRARAADRYALVDSVTQVVAHRFRLASPTSSVAAATTSSPMAYRLYEEGLRAYFSSDLYAAQRLMRAALEEDSTFAMAAYYEATVGAAIGIDTLPDGRRVTDAQRTALRLARRAPEGQRLMISANLLIYQQEPEALAVAESLGARYPDDPRALATLGHARWTAGDWAGSVQAIERAIALDSASDSKTSPVCHLCDDYEALAETYMWWDSLPAAARTEQRHLKARPDAGTQWFRLAFISARLGDGDAAHSALRHSVAVGGGDRARSKLRIDITLGDYEAVERDARPLLASSAPMEWADGLNLLLLALRNEGRLRDAIELHRTGWLAGFPAVPASPNDFDAGILNLERGDARAAAAVFHAMAGQNGPQWGPGFQARVRTWNTTLEAMALAASGDTSAVRALVDTVERWGSRSAYGRDRRAHHYLRGLVFAAQRRDEDAVRSFRAAIHSPNLGFTRVNYELARALLRLGRPAEAVNTLQSSLRGEIDASNLYITRTDLHELLAQALDSAGQRDSAAVHYRAVVSAWRRADARYQPRRDRAAAWLAQYERATGGR
jgi:DNA-binding SARP family transcriptional activator/tetratricopeptide (TPR) repeat protein